MLSNDKFKWFIDAYRSYRVHLFPFSFQLPLETTLVTTNANDTSGKNDTDTMNVLCCIPPSYQDSNIQCSYRIVSVVDTPISLTPATEVRRIHAVCRHL